MTWCAACEADVAIVEAEVERLRAEVDGLRAGGPAVVLWQEVQDLTAEVERLRAEVERLATPPVVMPGLSVSGTVAQLSGRCLHAASWDPETGMVTLGNCDCEDE